MLKNLLSEICSENLRSTDRQIELGKKGPQEKISGKSFCNAFIIKVQRTMCYVQSLLD